MFRLIWINLLVLLAGVVALELVFGTWFSQTHALYQFTKPRDLRIERDNPLGDDPPRIVYTRDANGMRGLDAGVDAIDLLTVGGSTTDQRMLDDSQTFQAVLRDLFAADGRNIVIANAGIDGQSTFGHIQNFASWFNRIDGFRPRFILYYVGINDMLIMAETGYDGLEARSARLKVQLFVREKSALYQLYTVVRRALASSEMGHVRNSVNFAAGPGLATEPALPSGALDAPEVAAALDGLRGRVERLAALARDLGAEPVFVTQRSAAWTRRDGRIAGVPHLGPGFYNGLVQRFGPINGVDIHDIERKVTDAVMAGCTAAAATCLDLFAELDFDPERDFYDDLHTNPAGSAAIARYLHGRLSGIDGF